MTIRNVSCLFTMKMWLCNSHGCLLSQLFFLNSLLNSVVNNVSLLMHLCKLCKLSCCRYLSGLCMTLVYRIFL
jgi:hypothetical protein